MGQGEEASVRTGRWAGLVEPIGVESKVAAWRERGGVTSGVQSGLLDDQLTVLEPVGHVGGVSVHWGAQVS